MSAPVNIVCGYLGSGKTTLIRRMLQREERILLIQNELSDVMGIEAPLFTDASGRSLRDMYEIPNGCVCCSSVDLMVATLNRAFEAMTERGEPPQRVIVEVAGSADPIQLMNNFWVDDDLLFPFQLQSVICLVDRTRVSRLLTGCDMECDPIRSLVLKQLVVSDVLLLNKVSEGDEGEVASIVGSLRELNQFAPIIKSDRCDVDIASLLFEAEKGLAIGEKLSKVQKNSSEVHKNWAGFCSLDEPEAAVPLLSEVFEWFEEVVWRNMETEPLDFSNETAAMKNMQLTSLAEIYRIKGMFRVKVDRPILLYLRPGQTAPQTGDEITVEVQGVSDRIEVSPVGLDSITGAKLLIVGKDLSNDEYRKSFRKLLRVEY